MTSRSSSHGWICPQSTTSLKRATLTRRTCSAARPAPTSLNLKISLSAPSTTAMTTIRHCPERRLFRRTQLMSRLPRFSVQHANANWKKEVSIRAWACKVATTIWTSHKRPVITLTLMSLLKVFETRRGKRTGSMNPPTPHRKSCGKRTSSMNPPTPHRKWWINRGSPTQEKLRRRSGPSSTRAICPSVKMWS